MSQERDLRKYRKVEADLGSQFANLATEATLQSILSETQDINLNLTDINISVDGLETLIDDSNILLGSIDTTAVNILASVQEIAVINADIFEEITATGNWSNGVETAVGATAVNVAGSNANRKKLIIQNTGNANARIGITGVTATTGTRLVPGGIMILEPPYVESNAIFAIREGLVSTIILTQETT